MELARDDQVSERTAGGWAAHKAKGTNMYAEKRAILRASAAAAPLANVVDKIQAAPPMGTTETARPDHVRYQRMRPGLDWAWPEGSLSSSAQERPEIGPGLYASGILAILRAQGGREHTTAKRVRLETELGLEPGALKRKDDIFAKIAAAEQLDRAAGQRRRCAGRANGVRVGGAAGRRRRCHQRLASSPSVPTRRSSGAGPASRAKYAATPAAAGLPTTRLAS